MIRHGGFRLHVRAQDVLNARRHRDDDQVPRKSYNNYEY